MSVVFVKGSLSRMVMAEPRKVFNNEVIHWTHAMCQAQPRVLRHFAKEAKIPGMTFSWGGWVYADAPDGSHEPSLRTDPGLAWSLTSSSHFLEFNLWHERELTSYNYIPFIVNVCIYKSKDDSVAVPLTWGQVRPTLHRKDNVWLPDRGIVMAGEGAHSGEGGETFMGRDVSLIRERMSFSEDGQFDGCCPVWVRVYHRAKWMDHKKFTESFSSSQFLSSRSSYPSWISLPYQLKMLGRGKKTFFSVSNFPERYRGTGVR